jgi:hypothetical protein
VRSLPMTITRLILFVAAETLPACSSAAPQYRPPTIAPVSSANAAARILAIHNRERAAAGVAPLVWDASLEAGAAIYARELAVSGVLRHSNRQARRGIRENLWIGLRGYWPVETMVASWTGERRNFRPGIFPDVSRTGNWMDAGHYSQMIWPTTTRLGCAIGSSRQWEALVCRYAPAGNIDGRRVP